MNRTKLSTIAPWDYVTGNYSVTQGNSVVSNDLCTVVVVIREKHASDKNASVCTLNRALKISNVKKKIAKRNGLLPRHVIVTLRSKVLCDDRSLKDYKILTGDVLEWQITSQARVAHASDPDFVINIISGDKGVDMMFQHNVHKGMSIAALRHSIWKVVISQGYCCKLNTIHLYFASFGLNVGDSVGMYGISDGDTIAFSFRCMF
eukprot:345491_1